MTTLLAFPYPAVIKYFDFYKVTWFESSIHFPVELLCLRRNKIFPLAATQKLFFLKKAAGKRHINPIYAKGSFYTPWKIRKSLIFWRFQGVKSSGIKWVKIEWKMSPLLQSPSSPTNQRSRTPCGMAIFSGYISAKIHKR